jgi:branched-chain amino acid transport system ATP-binding protein
VARLIVESLEAGYDGVRVLRSVALEAGGGEFVAVVGPNGAGKSTLLKAIAGMLRPWAGTIKLEGERIDGRSPWEIAARGLTLIPEGRRLFGPLSVRENLELGAFVPRGGAGREDTLRVVYRLFPVLDAKQRLPAQHLSGGEQQMLALARGLMMRPRLLCLDDPFLGLGRAVVDAFCVALRAVREEGLTIVATGQHVRRLLRLATRAYLLDEGQVILSGTGEELLASEQLRRILLP